ncbi:MAG: hypothetical protein Q9164_000029 [Protoblastenia rupestris]
MSEGPLATAINNLNIDEKVSEDMDNPEKETRPKEDGRRKAQESSLYPKILKLADFVYEVKALRNWPFEDAKISLTGSIKLHGTHADIVYTSPTSSGFRLQSRNKKALVPGNEDNAGFAAYIASIGPRRILSLRDRLIARYQALNPDSRIEGEIILAGEWCGTGIQKKVAISQLPRFFAIISMNINGSWVEDWKYADICDEDARVYHIGKAGFFNHELNLDDLRASEVRIKDVVDEVERACPFAKALGAAPGQGEGIVWKATELCGDPAFWFKSKGDLLAVSNSSKLPASAVDMENRERVENFAKAVATEVRLEQGWEYLGQKDASDMGPFLKWIVADCLTEEKIEIDELKISKGKLSPAIAAIAKPWFWEKLRTQSEAG